jgi:hypothetical protein
VLTLLHSPARVPTMPEGLLDLVAELRDLPDGLATPVSAGLVVADVLRALGWAERLIAAAIGVDLAALESARPEVLT